MSKINKTLRNSIIFSFIFTIFFLADFLLKHFLFNISDVGKPGIDYKVIGIRSVSHDSTTFLDFFKLNIDMRINIAISLSVAYLITLFIIFAKSKWVVFGLSIMLAGTIGNSLDNIFQGYVRDILYTPWLDRGTFNLADIFIIIGVPFVLIPTLFNLYK